MRNWGTHLIEDASIKEGEDDIRALESVTSMDHLLIVCEKFTEKHENEPLLLDKIDKSYAGDPQGDWESAAIDDDTLRSINGCESHFRTFKKR